MKTQTESAYYLAALDSAIIDFKGNLGANESANMSRWNVGSIFIDREGLTPRCKAMLTGLDGFVADSHMVKVLYVTIRRRHDDLLSRNDITWWTHEVQPVAILGKASVLSLSKDSRSSHLLYRAVLANTPSSVWMKV
jgi:hypothetical protein